MANGDYLSSEELQKLIIPIKKIQDEVNLFGKEHGLGVIFYSRGWPHFEIEWKNSNGVDCLIQLYMDDDKKHFTLWVAGTMDICDERYMKDIILAQKIKPPFDIQSIVREIERGYKLCDLWKFEDLEP